MTQLSQTTPERVEELLSALREQAATTRASLSGARISLERLRAAYESKITEDERQLVQRTQRWLRDRHSAISARYLRRRESLTQTAGRIAGQLAGGPLSMSWEDPRWADPPASPGTHLRIGTLDLPGAPSPVPAVVPFVGAAGWLVQTSPETFSSVAHSLVVRALAAFGPNSVRVTAFDPGLSSDLGLYSELRQIDRLSVPPPISATNTFEQSLVGLLAHLGAVEDSLASQGLHSVAEHQRDQGALGSPLHLLLIYSDAGPLSPQGAQNLGQLIRVGGPRGAFTLVAQKQAPHLALLAAGLPKMSAQRGATAHGDLPGLDISLDVAPERDTLQRIVGKLARRPVVSSAPTLALAQLVEEIEDPWLDEGENGLEVAYGRSGRANLVLRLRTQDPPMPNAIIGGAVGEGKSNLLLTLLYGLAARYSPHDLEMVLVDLKDGVEFSRFAPDTHGRNWLPHVRVLALEFDREFALKTLEWAEQTVHDRGVLMRESGTSTLGEYRRRTGRPLPRLLIVIDEFHRLFEGADQDVDRAARLLESLARTARAAGVHLILASQTISGIRGLASKSEAIFSQFHNRISLKNTAAESQAILAPRNVAAAELVHRGEVIANESLGEDPAANLQGLVAFADRTYTRGLQQRLWTEGSTGTPPRVFRAATWAPEPARWPEPDGTSLCSITPGAPISVTEHTRVIRMAMAPEQAVLVLGSELELVTRVLASCLHSALCSSSIRTVTIFDGLAGAGAASPTAALLQQVAHRAGAVVHRHARAEVVDALADVTERAARTGPELTVMLGLDTLVEFDGEDPSTFLPRTDRLRALLRDGGSRGVAVLGWWQSRRRAEEQLGYGLPGARGFAFCGSGKEDLQAICGAAARQPEGWPRFSWYDRSGNGETETLVPFDLIADITGVAHGRLG